MSAVGTAARGVVLLVGCLRDRNGVLECQRTDWRQLSLVPTLHQRREKCKKQLVEPVGGIERVFVLVPSVFHALPVPCLP